MFNKGLIDKIYNLKLDKNPFNHAVIDDFFDEEFAAALEKEFPEFDSPIWYNYDNPLEIKKTSNFWDKFPPNTYRAFWDFCDTNLAYALGDMFGKTVFPDIGLNGGGWHIHGNKGKLNVHQDYSIHPKIPYQRKLNIIVHLSRDWDTSWGGGLEFWSHNHQTNRPREKIKTIDIKFNRAVIFDTTQHSWHGLPGALTCPNGVYRKTLAMYYLSYPDSSAVDRSKALYVPDEQQKNDQSVLEFIEKRTKIGWERNK
jgi:hypothetical protein